MKIVACLAWYREPPEFLHRCVLSLKDVADQLICYDGAWDLFPHATPQSTDAENYAIRAAAEEANIPWTIYTPATTWGSQVEKRAALMLEANETDADWLLVIDGDEYVATHERYQLRQTLEHTDKDVAQVLALRTTGYDGVNTPGRIRRIYRRNTQTTVETAHNGYRTADGRWLHGDSAYVNLEPACDVSSYLLLHHERLNRGDERNRAALDYRKARLQAGCEAWR